MATSSHTSKMKNIFKSILPAAIIFAGVSCSTYTPGTVPTEPAQAANFDLLPGNLIHNGDFEQGESGFSAVLEPGARYEISEKGAFESRKMLSVTVPAELRKSENFLAQAVKIDPAEPCRSYRVTWWQRYKVLSDEGGGAGIMVSFYNAAGELIGRTGTGHLLKLKSTADQWKAIDQIRDGWWDSYDLFFTLPENAVSFRLECGLFKAAGSADFDRIFVEPRPAVAEMLAESSPLAVKVTPDTAKEELPEMLFGLNAEFRYPGIYFGTLPEENPQNRRREFADALNRAGARVLRFPGGMPAHWYFTEGPEAMQKLAKLLPQHAHYYTAMYYPRFEDVLDFCRRYGFEMYFEINTMFFVDSDGEVKPIAENNYKKNLPQLYDRNRLPEATAAFKRFVAKLPPGAIRYWEFGNEEFALMSVEEYAAIITAFLPIIKAYNPDASITVTGNTWPVALCELLAKNGVIDDINYLSAHYPWGSHWYPEAGKRADLERFVCGKLDWAMNTNAHLKMLRAAGFDKVKMAGNETSVFKFHQTWDPHRVIYTPAQGLLFAANWIEAMKLNDMDVLTFHDLESPFFGMILFNQYYDPRAGLGSFKLLKKGDSVPPVETPAEQLWFNRYLVLPSGEAMRVLSNHVNMNVLATEITTPAATKRPLFDLLASADGDRLLVTLVNRGAVSRGLSLDISCFAKRGTVERGGIRWPGLDGLPRPAIEQKGTFAFERGTVKTTLEPFSITQLTIKY